MGHPTAGGTTCLSPWLSQRRSSNHFIVHGGPNPSKRANRQYQKKCSRPAARRCPACDRPPRWGVDLYSSADTFLVNRAIGDLAGLATCARRYLFGELELTKLCSVQAQISEPWSSWRLPF